VRHRNAFAKRTSPVGRSEGLRGGTAAEIPVDFSAARYKLRALPEHADLLAHHLHLLRLHQQVGVVQVLHATVVHARERHFLEKIFESRFNVASHVLHLDDEALRWQLLVVEMQDENFGGNVALEQRPVYGGHHRRGGLQTVLPAMVLNFLYKRKRAALLFGANFQKNERGIFP